MDKTSKILLITPNFNLLCGRSKSVFNLASSLKRNNIEIYIATNGGDNIKKLANSNFDIIYLRNFSEGINLRCLIKSIIELWKIIKERKFNVIHSHHRFFELAVNILNLLMFRHKLLTLFTAHNTYNKKRLFQFRSKNIIAVSDYVKDNLINKHKVNPKKITVLYNFLLEHEVKELQENIPRTNNEKVVILAAGRLDESKNILLLLRSMKQLDKNNVILYLVGSGYQIAHYKEYIKKHKLNVIINYPVVDFFEFIKKSDICILPSVNEGFSYFVLECMIANKYIIISDNGGPLEIVRDYVNYKTFNSHSKMDLANKILSVLEDSSKFENKIFGILPSNFTEENYYKNIKIIYEI